MPKIASRKMQLAMVLFCSATSLGFACGGGGDWVADGFPAYDTDGDSLSDAVETNPANAHHGFVLGVKNVNPSLAKGIPGSGTLPGGINLVNQSTGYYHYLSGSVVDTDDWGTLALVNSVEGVGRFWWALDYEEHCWVQESSWDSPRMHTGDMSLKPGGYFDPHTLHQNGLDVDVRYVRHPSPNSEGENATLNIANNPELWDTLATVDLLNCWSNRTNNRLNFIYINRLLYDQLANPVPSWLTRREFDHFDHFHAQIYDPDGPND